jgi:hypothetical protein
MNDKDNHHLGVMSNPFLDMSIQESSRSVGSTPELPTTGFFCHPCFDVTLDKKDGSLGFTIHKKEDGFLYVKEVIREPAILEPLMTPGDRILLVNGVNVSCLTHEGAILYLRSLPNRVTLKIQPVFPDDVIDDILEADMSSEGYASLRKQSARGRKQLRPEALMMIKEKSGMNSLSRLRLRNKEKSSARMTQLHQIDDDSSRYENNEEVGCRDKSLVNKTLQVDDYDSQNNNSKLCVINTSTMLTVNESNNQHDDIHHSSNNYSSHDMSLGEESPAGSEEVIVESNEISGRNNFNTDTMTSTTTTCSVSSPVVRLQSKIMTSPSTRETNLFSSSRTEGSSSPPSPPPRKSVLSKQNRDPSLLFSNDQIEDNDHHNLNHSISNKSNNSRSSSTTESPSLPTVIPCYPLNDDDSSSSLGINNQVNKKLVKSESSDGFKSVVHVSSPSHVIVNFSEVNDPGKVKNAAARRSSTNAMMDTREDSIVVSAKLSKWRGGNLTDHHYLQGIRDEQDSGFGDTVTFKDTFEKPLARKTIEVTLEKGWTSRLGIQLMDDLTKTPPDCCVVKSVIDHTVASQDGRIRPGFKMTTVNGQSLEGKSAKEVIEFLRRIKGKVHMKFLIPSSLTPPS